uniref:Uncharacterized protein n=1 Tax=Magallana gigas TaxID=29159 RepID=A0A8W8MLW7_MAGGI
MASYIDYEDPAWTYVYVPAYSYDDEPLGFFINPRENMYSGVRSYDDSTFDIRRRRYILEDQLLGDDWDYIPLPRRHASPVRRRSRSVSREYVPVPTFRRSPSAGKYARQLRFDSRTSWVPFPSPKEDEFSVNLDLKTDALNRVLLRRDIDTALRSSYANKGRSAVRSKRDFDLSELQRLDRKQDQISRYLRDFKRDAIRAKYQSRFRYY